MYQAFDTVEFDPVKSDEVLEVRGFNLFHAARMLPRYVLEREDTRGGYAEPRFRIIGEVVQQVLVMIYTPRGTKWWVITAWGAEDRDPELWHER